MKNILITLLLLSGLCVKAQTFPIGPTPSNGNSRTLQGENCLSIAAYAKARVDSVYYNKTASDVRYVQWGDTIGGVGNGKIMSTYSATQSIASITSSMGNYVLKTDSTLQTGYVTPTTLAGIINVINADVNDLDNRLVNDSSNIRTLLNGKQPIGSYLVGADTSSFRAKSSTLYQAFGNYLTATDTTSFRVKSNTLYQASGSYQPAGTYIIPSDTTGFRAKSSTLYQGVGSYLIPSDTTGFRAKSNVLYQGTGNYLVPGDTSSFRAKSTGTYTPLTRTLTINGTGLDLSSNRTWTLAKADVGLSNADNTSDANKPISAATQTALNLKFTTPSGTTLQYVRGDGTLGTTPIVPTLTTTGSGAATLIANVLNIPTPSASGTVTSVGVTSSDFSVSGSPVITSGNITVNLNTSGVSAGSYNNVTVTTKGIVTAGSSLAIAQPVISNSFTSGTAFQPRSGGSCFISVQSTLGGLVGVTGTVTVGQSTASSGTYSTVSTTRLLISIVAVTSDMDSGSIPVPAGGWVKITLTGAVTATYTRWDT